MREHMKSWFKCHDEEKEDARKKKKSFPGKDAITFEFLSQAHLMFDSKQKKFDRMEHSGSQIIDYPIPCIWPPN